MLRALFFGFFAIASLAFAQETLSLEQAINEALANNGLLEAGRQRVAVAAGLRQQALIGTNPRLIFQTENTRPNEFRFFRDTDDFLYLQHTLETGQRRIRRGDLASAQMNRVEGEREVLAADIRARVKRAYWSAAGAQQTAHWLEDNLVRFSDIVRYHEIRVREGAIAEADLLRVQLEESKLRVTLTAAHLASERARIELLREMSRTTFPQLRLTANVTDLAKVVQGAYDQALDRRAEVRLAQQAVAQAKANEKLQEAVAKPNVDAVFGAKRVAGSPTQTSYTTLMGGLQMDLPFFNRNQGNITASIADTRSSEATLGAVRARIAADIEGAQAAVAIRRDELTRILEPMRQQAEESATIAQSAYRIGGVDLLRLLDAERSRIETQLVYYQSLTDYQQSLASLEVALGLP
jgi:cobalt-zinc-cadmium efflux system outer membrane protein